RAGLLRTEQRVVDAEVESLIRVEAGTGVGAHQHVAFPEVVAEAHFEGVVAVVARIFENEVAAGAAGRVVGEAARAAFFEEFRFQIDGGGELSLEAQAPIYETGSLERVSVHGKCSGHGRGKHAVRVEEIVFALTGERTGDEEQERRIVDQTDSCGKLGVARVVENVGSGEARREERSADDFIPIETDAGLDEQTIADQPPVFGIGTGLEVVSGGRRTSGKSGIARTRRIQRRHVREAGIRSSGRILPLAQKRYGLAGELGVVDKTVEVRSEFEIVTAMPVMRSEKQIR